MSQVDAVMNNQNKTSEINEGQSIEEIRSHRKRMLVRALNLFAKLGYDEGLAGHITVRDPEKLNEFWVNPLGIAFKAVKENDLLKVSHKGEVVEGNGYLNGAAFVIHSKIHQQNPKVNAAVHAHSLYGKTWSSLGQLLTPITQDACAFYDDHALFNHFNGVVLDTDEGLQIAETIKHYKAIILQNHGILTVGETLESAAWWFITMERCCKSQLLAEAAGTPINIDHETALKCRQIVGTEETGYYSFLSTLEHFK